MTIIIIGILALALLAGLALFVFQNAAKLVALVVVAAIGYVGWHIYLNEKGIIPNQATESVGKQGESLFNDALDTMIGSVSKATDKAMDTVKEKASEDAENAIDTTKRKTSESVSKAAKKAKEKVHKAID